jgi:ribosomal subunit interface protein
VNGHPSEFRFEFHSPDFTVPQHIADYTADKLRTRLAKFSRWVQAVLVHVKDENSVKHGVDKSCHMEARITGLEPTHVSKRHQDLRAAIDCAIDELEQAVQRHTERVRTRRRERGRKLVRHAKLGV